MIYYFLLLNRWQDANTDIHTYIHTYTHTYCMGQARAGGPHTHIYISQWPPRPCPETGAISGRPPGPVPGRAMALQAHQRILFCSMISDFSWIMQWKYIKILNKNSTFRGTVDETWHWSTFAIIAFHIERCPVFHGIATLWKSIKKSLVFWASENAKKTNFDYLVQNAMINLIMVKK